MVVFANKGGVDRLGVWVGLWRRGFKGRRLVVRGVPGQSLIEVSPSSRFESAICFRASGDSLQASKKRRIMVASDLSGKR